MASLRIGQITIAWRPDESRNAARRLPGAPRLISRGWALLREWRRRARSRAQLAALDERMQRDIGVSPLDVARECQKPFWRA